MPLVSLQFLVPSTRMWCNLLESRNMGHVTSNNLENTPVFKTGSSQGAAQSAARGHPRPCTHSWTLNLDCQLFACNLSMCECELMVQNLSCHFETTYSVPVYDSTVVTSTDQPTSRRIYVGRMFLFAYMMRLSLKAILLVSQFCIK